VNDVAATGTRSYLGGSVELTALATVLREIPNRSAIRDFGTPSTANLRINAQSSKVITLQVSSAHFSPGRTAHFSAVIDSNAASRLTWLVARSRSARQDPWGQIVARLISPDGAVGGLSYAPSLRL